jgi:hypothetical protein
MIDYYKMYGFNPNSGLLARDYIKSLYSYKYHSLIDFGLEFLGEFELKYDICLDPLEFIKELIEQKDDKTY